MGVPARSWSGAAEEGHRENHHFVTKQSWRPVIKLSSIIDNLIQARLFEFWDAGAAVMSMTEESGQQARRKAAMAVLAHAAAADIAARLETIAVPAHENLRDPENGLVMVRGRIGGDGAAFNLGEATVSRAAVRLATGEVGFGYTLGRDGQKARMIALCDALIQTPDHAGPVEAQVLVPLRAAIASERKRKAAEAAATRVDFYTMVRGEG
jgi:alpha-D-ribose 1-methylphosphonate 5-triphosphate synthase subunit PhnG